ncbi:MAG: hypothetical protein F6K65_33105 [Moorea sp. SIO3C2]|nr:hypothetical protein [Moorena sp. SIO3C2]
MIKQGYVTSRFELDDQPGWWRIIVHWEGGYGRECDRHTFEMDEASAEEFPHAQLVKWDGHELKPVQIVRGCSKPFDMARAAARAGRSPEVLERMIS